MLPVCQSRIYIQSFKHDGRLHRTWDQGYVLQANPHRQILVTDKAWVTDEDGKVWHTREPALCYFYDDKWFNVIAMIREYGIYYYCNLASPALYDGEALKYIDYDLDYKIFPDGTVVLMDEDEYHQHQQEMHYPPQLDKILTTQMAQILSCYKQGLEPFSAKENEELFQQYLDQLSKQ